jgi:TonB-dependent SusC/RagA subfamily outer membrane receptor
MKKFFLILAIFLTGISWTIAQRTITGTVTDGQSKEALVGASVLVKGTTIGKITDLDGKYSFEVAANATTLVFSYVGYQTQEVTLGASNVIDVTLSEGNSLKELIVTALGTTRESKALGYAAQQVDGDKLKNANTTNVVDALNGNVAGAQITSSSGTAGASSRIVLRGPTSLDGNNQALFVIDGLRIDNSELSTDAQSIGTPGTAGVAQSNRAIDINPSDIESITVLKGAAASALYGIDGARGVILITTKKGNKKGKGLTIEYNTTVTQSQINKKVPLQNKFGLGTVYLWQPFGLGSKIRYDVL